MIAFGRKLARRLRVMVCSVTRLRRPSELLALALSVVACLAFVLGLRDVGLAPGRVVKAADPIPIRCALGPVPCRLPCYERRGTAVAQATVQVFWEDAGRFYLAGAASTDAAGAALPNGAAFRARLAAGGGARFRARFELARAELEAAFRARRVALHPDARRDGARRSFRTDRARHGVDRYGRSLALRCLDRRPRSSSLHVWPPHRGRSRPPLRFESISKSAVRGAPTITLRRLASPAVAVEGVDGKPAPGATVMIAGPSSAGAQRRSGRARRRPDRGAFGWQLRFARQSGRARGPHCFGFELARGANEKLTLRLERGRTVVALVTDGEGKSPIVVPNADVVLAEGGVSSFPIRGRTGTDGALPGSDPLPLALRRRASSGRFRGQRARRSARNPGRACARATDPRRHDRG